MVVVVVVVAMVVVVVVVVVVRGGEGGLCADHAHCAQAHPGLAEALSVQTELHPTMDR